MTVDRRLLRRLHERLRAAARRHPHSDIAIAVVVYAVTLVTTAAGPSGGRLNAAALIAAALACGALVVRLRWPYTAFLISALAAELYLALFPGHAGSMVLAAPLIALYTVADASNRPRALTIGVLAVLAFGGLHLAVRPSSWMGADNLALAALGGLAIAAGEASRNRRAYLAEVEARAQRAEQERDAEAARKVTDERLRIARDLHDVVGHHLALINVQSGVAAHVLDAQPEQARSALTHVREASRTALDQLRDTIGLLRQPDDQAAPTEPIVGLAGLPELLDSFRRSGLVIDERVDGPTYPVAVAVDLTAYRVIQESLTNVCKHAGSASVALRLRYDPDALHVVVDNSAPVAAPPAERATATVGHGVLGMRERVTALGGELRAGTRPDGGYRVAASLPSTNRATS